MFSKFILQNGIVLPIVKSFQWFFFHYNKLCQGYISLTTDDQQQMHKLLVALEGGHHEP